MKVVKIGVLSVQGDFDEHISHLRGKDTVEVYPIKNKSDLAAHQYDGLVFPGGESTTFRRLMDNDKEFFYQLENKIVYEKTPVWGTCCGLILFAKKIDGDPIKPGLQLAFECLDISVLRNAYGSQNDSFVTSVRFKDDEFNHDLNIEGIFIRAPAIENIGNDVKIVATLRSDQYKYPIVGVRQNNVFATTFHPEFTSDKFVHDYFIQFARMYSQNKN